MPDDIGTAPSFEDLNVPAPLVKVLAADGKTTAFPIQADSLPDSLAGRDVLGRGRTGSGKTLAFGIPMVARLGATRVEGEHHPGKPVGLVLAPTRELATQIADVIAPLAGAYGLKVTTVYGGVKQYRQELAFRRGADIAVACPGRLEDLCGQGIIDLSLVQVTVIDEADYMADLGFLPGVTRILKATPAGGQRLLFSATLDRGVDKLVNQFLQNPVTHAISDPTESVSTMVHTLLQVPTAEEKRRVVLRLAGGTGRRILFTRTKFGAQRLARNLTHQGIPAVDLQGNLSQSARDRNLAKFEKGTVNVLVATDVAARGVDVSGVAMVLHVDPPADDKTYLHRSGRTARAGADGQAVTVALPNQIRDMRRIYSVSGIEADPQRVTADSPLVSTLEGTPAPRVEPPADAPTPSGERRSGRGPRQHDGRRNDRSRWEGRRNDHHSENRRSDDSRNDGRHNRNDRNDRNDRFRSRDENSRDRADRWDHSSTRSGERRSRSEGHSSSRYDQRSDRRRGGNRWERNGSSSRSGGRDARGAGRSAHRSTTGHGGHGSQHAGYRSGHRSA
ncbi:MAG: DEAD/DEAH box helicase [Microbacteriaceae bacterium]|jgi:superfamily II DNA/RNA helicase|nr:DEAD/DEAH box helicase [Microbacteriaceae bacterium]MCI1207030.1 DEAD/DEAH box helicase [Microbacteriaceae bacterium]